MCRLRRALILKPQDYTPHGEEIRWANFEQDYPDCSCGCIHYHPLAGDDGNDWGVCSNPTSHRCGLLTFEHQGCLHFQGKSDEETPV